MRRHIILLLLGCMALLTACKSDNEITVDDHCYITSVTLGTLHRSLHTTSTSGADSIISTTYTGSGIAMTVDQRTLTIENRDSLLYGTRLDALLLNISYVGATLAYREADDEESDWQAYSSTDSMDLRKPLHLYTLAKDGNSFRIYTIRLNVHQQEGDSLSWTHTEDCDLLAGMTERHAAVVGDKLMVLGRTATGIKRALRSSLGSSGEWTLGETNLPQEADVAGIKQRGTTLYAQTPDGALYSSDDGAQWTALSPATEGLTLAALGDDLCYALIGGRLYGSTDAITWHEETLDDEADQLPTHNLRCYIETQDNGTRRLALMGYRDSATDTTAVVWSKAWGQGTAEAEATWMYIVPTADNPYRMPRLEQLSLLPYDGRGLAMGGASEEGRGSHQALDAMYFSNDHGITWKPDYEHKLPAALKGVGGPLAATVDGENYIWLIADNQVWRGRLNRLGFERQ